MSKRDDLDDTYDYASHYNADRKADIEDYLEISTKKEEKKLKKKLKKPNKHQAHLDVRLGLIINLVADLRRNPVLLLDKEKYALYKQLGFLAEDLADECYSEKLNID